MKARPCNCPRYTFPHRRSDRCDDAEMEAMDVLQEQTREQWEAEERWCFDHAEAEAINSERKK